MISTLTKKAIDLGFIAVGFTRSEKPIFFDCFRKWISAGRQGDMHWLEKHLDLRKDPEKLLAGCQTIISLAYPYPSTKPLTSDGFSTARYTEPKKPDYHDRLKKSAKELVKTILKIYPGCRTRICVDSAPILERSYACASGMGFIGKNNALIIPGHGSYVFLAEILTTAQIPLPKTQQMKCQCGSCDLCLKACPAGALDAPFSINASKCFSYLTIEYKGKIKKPEGKKMGTSFFGCDVCQEVCPFNEDESSEDKSLPSTDEFLEMEEDEFKTRFGKSAFSRAGLNKIKSNIIAIKEWGKRNSTSMD